MARILRLKVVLDRVGLGRTRVYEMIQAGDFPAPVSLSTRAVGWREEDIEAWINSRPVTSSHQAHAAERSDG